MRNMNFDVHYYRPGDFKPNTLNPEGFHVPGDEPFTAQDVLNEVALRKSGYHALHYPQGTRWVPVFRVEGTNTWLELTPRIYPQWVDPKAFTEARKLGRNYAQTKHGETRAGVSEP